MNQSNYERRQRNIYVSSVEIESLARETVEVFGDLGRTREGGMLRPVN